MANNVIKFPTEERIRNRLKNKVNETIEIMDELYSQIDLCMENLCKLEEQATKVEQAYSIILKEYAKSVEIHQMEARYLAYCKAVSYTHLRAHETPEHRLWPIEG